MARPGCHVPDTPVHMHPLHERDRFITLAEIPGRHPVRAIRIRHAPAENVMGHPVNTSTLGSIVKRNLLAVLILGNLFGTVRPVSHEMNSLSLPVSTGNAAFATFGESMEHSIWVKKMARVMERMFFHGINGIYPPLAPGMGHPARINPPTLPARTESPACRDAPPGSPADRPNRCTDHCGTRSNRYGKV